MAIDSKDKTGAKNTYFAPVFIFNILKYSQCDYIQNTQRKEKIPDTIASRIFGGRGWIRTTEVTDNRFTVCPLWPLGNSPI